LSAAVYAASEGLHTILVEKSTVGGQASSTSLIENYLGFPDGIPGWELASRARRQALQLGAEIIVGAEMVGGRKEEDITHVSLSNGTEVASLTTICAFGVQYQRLWLTNEDRLLNQGLYYGAGSSEAERCRGHVFVIGGGNSAGQAALHLARFASQVTMLVRGEHLKNTLSAYLVARIENSSNIEVLTRSIATAVEGESRVEAIRYRTGTGQEICAKTQHVFVCIGGVPRTEIAEKSTILTDNAGYLLTGPDVLEDERSKDLWKLERDPFHLETSMPGVFAIGDCRHNSIKRFATAVGEGGAVIPLVFRYLKGRHLFGLR
jgi:thioredoxin reductase (NADPH)